MPLGSETQCAVLHGPDYVPGEHAGAIHLYRSTTSAAEFWLCDADADTAPSRGVHVVLVVDGPTRVEDHR